MNSTAPSHGIVTLADQNYFPGLETLYQSVQESFPTPVACFDIGLTQEQKNRAAGEYPLLTILDLPDNADILMVRESFKLEPALKKMGKRVWPLWLCPFLIAASPFQRVFWMDCDLVVLRGLADLFALLDDGPVFTPENLAPDVTHNKPELYQLLPIARAFNPQSPAANGGVSGWDLQRDARILEAYQYPIREAAERLSVREAISWHDQGALIWAIQNTGMEHRVLDTWTYNLCARHTAVMGKTFIWNRDVIAWLRDEVPEACLLHWNGLPVPWGQQGGV